LDWGVWIGFNCLRTGTVGGLLWARWWTFGFLSHGVSFNLNFNILHPNKYTVVNHMCEVTTHHWLWP
jgi:hypothetical protein